MPGFEIRSDCTYAEELGAAVTALGDGASLLDVEDAQVATGGLDNTGTVGDRVVAIARRQKVSTCLLFGKAVLSHAGDKKEDENLCRTIRKASLREHSRVAAAVGDSVVDHFDGVCWDVAIGVLSKNEEFRDLVKFCVVVTEIVPAKWANQRPVRAGF